MLVTKSTLIFILGCLIVSVKLSESIPISSNQLLHDLLEDLQIYREYVLVC